MSRKSVLASTLGMNETITQPNVQEGWAKLKALMKFSFTFDHVSDLLPPTLLSQQSGSFVFNIQLSLGEADILGRGREILLAGDNRSRIHYNTRVLIRCFKVESGVEVKIDNFPPSSTARVNDVFYRRDGTEGPIDITSSIQVSPNVTNVVNLDVSSPSGFYVVTIILVRALSPSAIVKRLSEKRIRPAETTKSKICRYHEITSSEVAVTSTKFSLVCPLSQKRFVVPAQGENCNHLTCFDLYTYLKLNSHTGKWTCPICNTRVFPAHLIVDGYWKDVVDRFAEGNDNSSCVLLTDEGTVSS